jgi:hypothetical protein
MALATFVIDAEKRLFRLWWLGRFTQVAWFITSARAACVSMQQVLPLKVAVQASPSNLRGEDFHPTLTGTWTTSTLKHWLEQGRLDLRRQVMTVDCFRKKVRD